jgi:hypothetical protein
VEGEPPGARFEFIAVRNSWIRDHYLRTILEALAAAGDDGNEASFED